MRAFLLLGLAAAATAMPEITSDGNTVSLMAPDGDVMIQTNVLTCDGNTQCGLGSTISTLMDSVSTLTAELSYQASTFQSTLTAELSSQSSTFQSELSSTRSTIDAQASMIDQQGMDLNASLQSLAAAAAMTIDIEDNYLAIESAASTYVTQSSLTANYPTTTAALAMSDSVRLYAENLVEALANITVNQSTAASIITAHQNLGLLDNNGTFTGNLLVSGNSDFRTLAPLLDHIVVLDGTLTIQSISSVDSLNPPGSSLFTNLNTITGGLIIYNNVGFTSIGNGSFPALRTIGGYMRIYNNANLASLGAAFPNLQDLGGPLTISNQALLGRNLAPGAFASLATIGGVSLGNDFNPQTMIYVGDFQGQTGQQILAQIDGYRIITGSLNVGSTNPGWSSMPTAFNAIRSVGGQLTIQNFNSLTTYANAFTNLGATGNFYLRNNIAVRTMGTGTSMGFRNLKMVFGTLTFTYHTSTSFTSMAGSFPVLRNVTGALQLQYNNYVNTMSNAFPQLMWVGQYLDHYFMQRLVTPSTFPVLEYAGGVRFQSTGYTGNQWNYNGAFPRLLRIGTASNLGLYFQGCTNLNSMSNAFRLLNRIDNRLYIEGNNNMRLTSIAGSFAQLQTVRQYLQFNNCPYLSNLNAAFPQLETVGSYLYVQSNSRLTQINSAFPSLSTVGSNFYITSNNALQSITGSFNALLSTQSQMSIGSNPTLRSITTSFTSLQTISSNFNLYSNNVLNALSGSFVNLTIVRGSFQVYDNYALQSVGNPPAFQNINYIQGNLYFRRNGGGTGNSGTQRNWCNSVDQYVCPATSTHTTSTTGSPVGRWQNSGYSWDADDCCRSFCGSSTTC